MAERVSDKRESETVDFAMLYKINDFSELKCKIRMNAELLG